MKRVSRETLLVLLAGALLALAANALSPRGLQLSRDYFPKANVPVTPAQSVTNPPAGAASAAFQRLTAKGLQPVSYEVVSAWFADPKREQRLFLFIDARNEKAFAEGHIPSALLLDYYRPEPYLPTVLPAAMAAEKIIIYCNGGECEDSEFTAQFLSSAGIPAEKIYVYVGGFSDWKSRGQSLQGGTP